MSFLRKQEGIHYYKVAGASAHDKKVEDLVAPAVFVPAVKDRKLQRVDDAAHSVNDSACQQPSECCGGHIVQDLGEGQYAGPAHSDIEYGGDPLRTVNPERLDQNPCDGDRPYNGEQDNSRLSLQDNQAYRSVTSGDQHGDHHMIDLLQYCIDFFRNIKCMVGRTCRIQQDQA